MTYNIRYDNASVISWDSNRWALRRDPIANLIKDYDVDIIGIQEGFSWQVNDLSQRLSNWNWYGVGREDGKQAGEFAAIFYKKNKFDVVQKGTFWLSQTPEKPSKGWDASDYRIASWVILKDKGTNQTFFVLNTHLEYVGREARSEGMKLIYTRLKDLSKGFPTIVMGDFNTTAVDTMTSAPYDPENLNATLKDSFHHSLNKPEGPDKTFNGGGNFSTKAELVSRIDYIFVSQDIEVLTDRVLTDSRDGNYFSDHLPVLVETAVP
jgi:endonuclease/exonuclease/phosphatase family metal-dependent hydrolase